LFFIDRELVMQLSEYLKAINLIRDKLKLNEIADFIFEFTIAGKKITDSEKNKFSDLIFDIRENLSDLNNNKLCKDIIDEFRLNDILNRATLGKLLSIFQISSDSTQISNNTENYRAFIHVALCCRLLNNNILATTNLIGGDRLQDDLDDDEIVEFELNDYGKESVELKRFSDALIHIQNIYIVLSDIYEFDEDGFSISYCDSGSNLLVGIKTKIENAKKIKETIISTWEKVQGASYIDFERKSNSILKGLDVAEEIDKKVQSGAITDEDGRRYKKRLLDSLDDLFNDGITIKDYESDDKDITNKLLEYKETKYIEHKSNGIETKIMVNTDSNNKKDE